MTQKVTMWCSLDIMPCKSTVAMVAYELGVISDPQVGEVMSMNHNITLSWGFNFSRWTTYQ